jgi:NAD(P)H-hydrate repair Nnr-like enzyme with NAD(P)H-hydrate epimerase domain
LTIVAVDAESDESAVKEDEKVCCIVCGTGFNGGDATRSATNFSAAFHVKRDGPF